MQPAPYAGQLVNWYLVDFTWRPIERRSCRCEDFEVTSSRWDDYRQLPRWRRARTWTPLRATFTLIECRSFDEAGGQYPSR